ncbi:MAG TPA: hypothetical protein VGS57_08980 [Thermoanaerobaculia bacterium]|jgi:tetrahydromethanopterin S-methyltransferase subunit F|nr:hypothetical protein [Thermoanaerobaculia bacterium]
MHLLYESLLPSANWLTIGLLFAVVLVCIGLFIGRLDALRRTTNIGREKLLDGRLWYTASDAASLFDQLGARGRRLYAWTAVTLDLFFPLAYGLLFALLLVRLWPPGQAWLLLLPILTVLADILENLTIATMIWTWRAGEEPSLAGEAAIFTLTKHIFLLLSVLAILIGFVHALPRLGCC